MSPCSKSRPPRCRPWTASGGGFCIVLGLCALLQACAPAATLQAPGAGPGGAPAGLPASRSVAAVLSLEHVRQGETVRVLGRYASWQGRCPSSPPVGRNDWMLEDGEACIYVHGPAPAPAGAGTPEPGGPGLAPPITVTGTVDRDPAGRPFLRVPP